MKPITAIPPLTGYPGSKAASGLCERIIRQMPPHTTYIEPFAGHAAVWRKKLPAASSFLIDKSITVCNTLKAHVCDTRQAKTMVVFANGLNFLRDAAAELDAATLVYVDPPYLLSTRTRLLYEHEFATAEEHSSLLTLLQELKCLVMISGYASDLYAKLLKSWRCVQIPAMTRGGLRTEHLWCNFAAPELLHDPRYAGGDYRERERIKRKRQRWATRFAAMPPAERQVIAQALHLADPATVEAVVAVGTAEGGDGRSA